jgi:hypothetical protein
MMMNDYQGVLKDLNEINVLEPNNLFILQLWGTTKCKSIDYGALSDLNKANGFQPNDAFILKTHNDLKNMLNDHEGASKDLKKHKNIKLANVFISNEMMSHIQYWNFMNFIKKSCRT